MKKRGNNIVAYSLFLSISIIATQIIVTKINKPAIAGTKYISATDKGCVVG